MGDGVVMPFRHQKRACRQVGVGVRGQVHHRARLLGTGGDAQQRDLVNYDFSSITQYPTWDAFRLGWGESGAASAHTQQ